MLPINILQTLFTRFHHHNLNTSKCYSSTLPKIYWYAINRHVQIQQNVTHQQFDLRGRRLAN